MKSVVCSEFETHFQPLGKKKEVEEKGNGGKEEGSRGESNGGRGEREEGYRINDLCHEYVPM